MPDHHPRYVVREITGYSISASATTAGNAQPQTSVWVADTWDCFREAGRFYSPNGGPSMLERRRRSAHVLAERLNVEHDAWLRDDGRVS